MHYTLEAREDDCLQNHTVHVSIRVCRPFTKGGCAHGIRGEGELCSTYSLDKCFAACLTWWRRRISITQVHEWRREHQGLRLDRAVLWSLAVVTLPAVPAVMWVSA